MIATLSASSVGNIDAVLRLLPKLRSGILVGADIIVTGSNSPTGYTLSKVFEDGNEAVVASGGLSGSAYVPLNVAVHHEHSLHIATSGGAGVAGVSVVLYFDISVAD